jgi:PPOX class probable FMN-dependent enzyme
MPFEHALRSVADLRSVYREPSQPALTKQIDHLDEHCRDFIRRAPFVLLATSDSSGRVDVSPRGGRPGFVRVLDDHRLAIPDLAGNNRLDSLRNVVDSPGVGLLFCVPGLDETLRVNGAATITTDPKVLEACADENLQPNVAIGVDVEEAFLHCAKALRRSSLWQPDGWPDLTAMPTAARILRDHCGLLEVEVAAVEARLAESYERTTWMVGGEG